MSRSVGTSYWGKSFTEYWRRWRSSTLRPHWTTICKMQPDMPLNHPSSASISQPIILTATLLSKNSTGRTPAPPTSSIRRLGTSRSAPSHSSSTTTQSRPKLTTSRTLPRKKILQTTSIRYQSVFLGWRTGTVINSIKSFRNCSWNSNCPASYRAEVLPKC